jgi:hypothetical protein
MRVDNGGDRFLIVLLRRPYSDAERAFAHPCLPFDGLWPAAARYFLSIRAQFLRLSSAKTAPE